MSRIFRLTFVCIMLFLNACSGHPPAKLQITDPASPLEVSAGQTFTLVLESNPTTGYHWALVGQQQDDILSLISNEYISTSDPGLVGGGGLEVWTFKAVQQGHARVILGYFPPSNTPTDPSKTVEFTIIVK